MVAPAFVGFVGDKVLAHKIVGALAGNIVGERLGDCAADLVGETNGETAGEVVGDVVVDDVGDIVETVGLRWLYPELDGDLFGKRPLIGLAGRPFTPNELVTLDSRGGVLNTLDSRPVVVPTLDSTKEAIA